MSLPSTADYATPWTADDQFIEQQPDDPCYSEPQDWPSTPEIDSDRYEPNPDDVAWLADQVEDWAAYEAWSRRLEELCQASQWDDRLEAIYGTRGVTDDDVTVVTGCAG